MTTHTLVICFKTGREVIRTGSPSPNYFTPAHDQLQKQRKLPTPHLTKRHGVGTSRRVYCFGSELLWQPHAVHSFPLFGVIDASRVEPVRVENPWTGHDDFGRAGSVNNRSLLRR